MFVRTLKFIETRDVAGLNTKTGMVVTATIKEGDIFNNCQIHTHLEDRIVTIIDEDGICFDVPLGRSITIVEY